MISTFQRQPCCLKAEEILNPLWPEDRSKLFSHFSQHFATNDIPVQIDSIDKAISHLLQSEEYWTHTISPEEYCFLTGALKEINLIDISKNDLINRISHYFRHLFFLHNQPDSIVKHSTSSISEVLKINLKLFLDEIPDSFRREILEIELRHALLIEKEAPESQIHDSAMTLLFRLEQGKEKSMTVNQFLQLAYSKLAHQNKDKKLYADAGFSKTEMTQIKKFLQIEENEADFTREASSLGKHLKKVVLQLSKSQIDFTRRKKRLKYFIYYQLHSNCFSAPQQSIIKYSKESIFAELKNNTDYYFSDVEDKKRVLIIKILNTSSRIGYKRKEKQEESPLKRRKESPAI